MAVDFTLQSSVEGTEFYVSSGDSQCVDDVDIPSSSFSDTSPLAGSVSGKSSSNCSNSDKRIHVYIWADDDQTDLLVDLKLYKKYYEDHWKIDVPSIVQGYNLNYSHPGTDKYVFTLASDQ